MALELGSKEQVLGSMLALVHRSSPKDLHNPSSEQHGELAILQANHHHNAYVRRKTNRGKLVRHDRKVHRDKMRHCNEQHVEREVWPTDQLVRRSQIHHNQNRRNQLLHHDSCYLRNDS